MSAAAIIASLEDLDTRPWATVPTDVRNKTLTIKKGTTVYTESVHFNLPAANKGCAWVMDLSVDMKHENKGFWITLVPSFVEAGLDEDYFSDLNCRVETIKFTGPEDWKCSGRLPLSVGPFEGDLFLQWSEFGMTKNDAPPSDRDWRPSIHIKVRQMNSTETELRKAAEGLQRRKAERTRP